MKNISPWIFFTSYNFLLATFAFGMDVSEYSKETLQNYNALDVHFAYSEKIEIISDPSQSGMAIGMLAFGAIGGMAAGAAIDFRPGESLQKYALPPEGYYANWGRPNLLELFDATGFFASQMSATKVSVEKSQWLAPLNLFEYKSHYSKRQMRENLVRVVKGGNPVGEISLVIMHRVRINEDQNQIWYLIEVTAIELPKVKNRGMSLITNKQGYKFLGVSRFSAMYHLRDRNIESLAGGDGNEFIMVVKNLAHEASSLFEGYFTDAPINNSMLSESKHVLAKYGLLEEKEIEWTEIEKKEQIVNELKIVLDNTINEQKKKRMRKKISRFETEIEKLIKEDEEYTSVMNEIEKYAYYNRGRYEPPPV